jgi:Fe2+ or Zn2+ uptake regulation protein
VETIYSDLYKQVPTLSRTTVYNTLDVLNKHGLIGVLTITGSEQRYDFDLHAHHHFLCKKCGAIIDIEVECPYYAKMASGEHRIDEVHGYFKGICGNCLAKAERV